MISELYPKDFRAKITLETLSFPTQQSLRIIAFGETEQAAKLAVKAELETLISQLQTLHASLPSA